MHSRMRNRMSLCFSLPFSFSLSDRSTVVPQVHHVYFTSCIRHTTPLHSLTLCCLCLCTVLMRVYEDEEQGLVNLGISRIGFVSVLELEFELNLSHLSWDDRKWN